MKGRVYKSRGIETRLAEAFTEVSPTSENKELRNQKFQTSLSFFSQFVQSLLTLNVLSWLYQKK